MPNDILNPRVVKQIIARHDDDMDAARTHMGMAKAAYGGRFWEWVHEEGKDHTDRKYRLFEDRYEVNHIKRGINVYHAALFPKRMAAVVGRTATTTGDPESAKLLLNSFLFSNDMRARIDTAIRQSLLYNGCGLKVSYEPRAGVAHKALAPHERVFARVFPYYELLLDTTTKDISDSRFIGHCFFKSKYEIADLYDIPLSALNGQRERSFLDDQYDMQNSPASHLGGDDMEYEYVRVLELCNLVDHYVDPSGEVNSYPGRFEVHLIDQGELSMEPVYVGEMPLWRPDGRPVPHILPQIFEHEAEYPLQGIAPCKSWLHQQAELNSYRSQMAAESRKNKTIFLYDRNLGSDIIQKIANAKSMDGIAIDPDNVLGGDLRRAVVPIEQPAISVNIREHASKAEQDLLSSFNFSPSAIGITQNVTAQEIRYQRDYTDSEFGRYAAARDRTLSKLAELALRAFVAAMLDDGDMESEDDGLDLDADLEMADLSEDSDAALFDDDTGAILSPADEEIDKRLYDAELGDMEARADDEDDEEEEEPEEEEPISDIMMESLQDGARVNDDTAELYAERGIETTGEETIQLLNAKGELVVITVEDIDSEFDIGFTETGRTPASDAEIRANLAQVLPLYMQLFDVVMQGGPQAVVATEAARAYYTEYSLPENLDPERLIAQLDEQSVTDQQQPTPPGAPAAPGQPPPEGQAAPAPQGQPQGQPQGDPNAVLEALVAQHGEDPQAVQALQVIVSALQSAPPDLLPQLTQQLMQIAGLPVENQVEGLVMLAQALSGDGAPAEPPPEAAAAPAPAAPQAEPPAPAAAQPPPPQEADPVAERLADAAPDLEDAIGLAERLLPKLQQALPPDGLSLLQQFSELVNQALSALNSLQGASDNALAIVTEAGELLEQAEDAAETLSSMAPAEMQADLDALIEAVSDAADALIDPSPGEGGLTEEDMDDDDEEQTDG